jgi:hypothetical protein
MLRESAIVGIAICLTSCAVPKPNQPSQFLGNPVVDARRALAKGDSVFLGILDDQLRMPGTTATVDSESVRTIRTFSRRSLGLSAEGWSAQRDSLTVYAAAYNTLIQEARDAASRRVP